jgi:signal transduction histidine kinase
VEALAVHSGLEAVVIATHHGLTGVDPIAEVVVARDRRQKSAVRQALFRFAASSMVLLLVLMLAIVLLADRIATQEALRDARVRGFTIGNLIAAPLVNARVRARVPGASENLTAVMRNRMGDGSMIHVTLWDKNGVVIWSDEKGLVGRQFALTSAVKAQFGTQAVTAEVCDLSEPQYRFSAQYSRDRNLGELLQVYAGTSDANNQPMVFEGYYSSAAMRRDERAIVYGFLPIVIAAMLLFQVAVLPMATSLARRVERGLDERSLWMRHALLASDLERRRIAQDLHDGVIQDLAGMSYAMPALEAQLADDSAIQSARDASKRVAEILRRDVAALRLMMTDIYPHDLEGEGFALAVHELARVTGGQGVEVQVEMAPDLVIHVDAARLAYRVVREGLRNVAKHAQATTAKVEVRRESQNIVVSVSDNGLGVKDGPVAEGHLGLRLLEDTVHDLGGQMTLRSPPSGGALLDASFPVNLVQP